MRPGSDPGARWSARGLTPPRGATRILGTMSTTAGIPERAPGPGLRDRRRTADSFLALGALVLLGIVSFVSGTSSFGGRFGALPSLTVTALTATAMPVALAWRRTHPAGSAAVVYAGALLHYLGGVPWLPVDVLVLVSLYSVTIYGATWARRAGLAGALLGSALVGIAMGYGWDGQPLGTGSWTDAVSWTFAVAGMVFATWAFAVARRSRIERIDRLVERAHRLEVERDQQVQIATAAERTRIAREMHDVVAHSLSVVVAQADGGRYAARSDPAAAERALATIATTGRDALADMRRILGVLRTPDGDPTAHRPQPAAGDLDELVAQVRATGTAVSLVRTGPPGPLPAGAGLTIYRICQEALTNVLKHAGPGAAVTVLLQWAPGTVTLQVDDDGRGAGAPTDGIGQGVVGMRERTQLFGGTLEVGPRPGGGFRVRARVPLAGPDAPPPNPLHPTSREGSR